MDRDRQNHSDPQPLSAFAPARLDLVLESLAYGLLDLYGVVRPPIPVLEMVQQPPAGLEQDLDLCVALPYGDGAYIRLLHGQGVVFVNPSLSSDQQRYVVAREMLHGLVASRYGQALGLTAVSRLSNAAAAYFARCLLMPRAFFPMRWETMPVAELAREFDVVPQTVMKRMEELTAH